ncbi:response regulator [Paenibacillus sp. GCM10012307]|uniref:Response regulator transcription factor n=1 Tax=Paenibacillus roseus TaxID=2798579 RepID=A0A934MRN0_9BACL|nr:response regulator transcription factor [Paenibacillus roseus]MBJ6362499.1 response regulator transcription factor [Paenibacillus roseus]
MIRIIHAEDEESWRYLIANKINRESDMQVVSSVASVNECLQELDRAHYDIALIDLNLSEDEDYAGGIRIAGEIQLLYAHVKVIMVTSNENYPYMERSVVAGARHYITKSKVGQIASLIRLVYHDADQSMQLLMHSLVKYKELSYLDTFNLTPREKTIYLHKKEGLSNQEIADLYMLSISTVRNQITSMLNKIGASTTAFAFQKIHKLLLE